MDIAGAEIIASASSSMAMLGGSDIDVEITETTTRPWP